MGDGYQVQLFNIAVQARADEVFGVTDYRVGPLSKPEQSRCQISIHHDLMPELRERVGEEANLLSVCWAPDVAEYKAVRGMSPRETADTLFTPSESAVQKVLSLAEDVRRESSAWADIPVVLHPDQKMQPGGMV